jgi:eukaryotic-like serine/threonine-protein kinase
MVCPDENTLVAFSHRLLEEAAAAVVEAHLRTCSECRQVVALLAGAGPGPLPEGSASAAAGPETGSGEPPLPERLLPPGTPVGRYILLRTLGAGGMGVVYAAYDPELARAVALKLLRAGQGLQEEARARLQREARAMARLTSPYVLPVHDVGTWREQVFITMEFVEGGTLARWLREQPRGWREVLARFLEAGRGLAAAHAAGLVHRDFKPDNVLVGDDGRVRVTDFGLARSMEGAEVPPEIPQAGSTGPLAPGLTRQGALVGTPAYMSPEQLEGRPVDARSDQFSFCVALYEGLCGERPFVGETGLALREAMRQVARPELARKRVPTWLRRVILRGLSPEPQARFPSMEALLEALEKDPGARRRRWGWGLGALTLVLAVVGVTYQVGERRSRLCQEAERKLEGIWDEPVRRSAEAALLATGKPHAASVWKSVAAWLDGYAAQWVGAHVEACEATRVRGEQSEQALDLRIACLERRRRDLGALTRLLREADAELLGRALPAAQGLPPVEGCADVEPLRARSALPEAEPLRAQAEALRQRLAEVRALYETGKYLRGLELAQETLEQAQALGFAPLEAEALLRAGQLQSRVGKAEPGKKTLLDAVLAAHAVSRPDLAAEGYLELTYATYRQPEEALHWARFAAAFIRASGDEPRLSAQLLHHEAIILGKQDRLGEALERMRQVTALWERVTGPESQRVAASLANTAAVLYQLRRSPEALPLAERAVLLEERALGPDSPSLAAVLQTLAIIQEDLGDPSAAVASVSRALEIAQRTLEPEHPWIPAIYDALGRALRLAGRYPEALEAYQRSLSLGEQQRGPKHLTHANVLVSLSDVLLRQRRYPEALLHAERALELAQELGPESPSAATALESMGAILLAQGQAGKASSLYQRAVTLREQAQGAEHEDLAMTLTGLGQCSLALGQPERALALLERGLRLWRNPRADDIAETRYRLALALEALGREPDRARALAEEARAGFQQAGPRAASERAEVERWLERRFPGR